MNPIHHPNSHVASYHSFSALVLKYITVQVSTHDEPSIRNLSHFVLELGSNDQVVQKVKLSPREYGPGIWDAEDAVIPFQKEAEVMFSVSAELDDKERQLVGSIGLNAPELFGNTEEFIEIPLICHGNFPNLILKTSVIFVPNVQELIENRRKTVESSYDGRVESVIQDARDAYDNFERYGNATLLNDAITRFNTATTALSWDDSRQGELWNDLGVCFVRRFELYGHLEDLADAIGQFQGIFDLPPNTQTDKPAYWANLGECLRLRFEHFGNHTDINDAISRLQTAVEATPHGHPRLPLYLGRLADSFKTRFMRFGSLADLDSAIAQRQKALSLILDEDSSKPSHSNALGILLRIRFRQLGNPVDINDAIKWQQTAVDLTPNDDMLRPQYISGLGNSLFVRFSRFGDSADLDDAITRQQTVLDVMPDDHPGRSMILVNLANPLQARFERFGNIADIDEAVAKLQAAVDLTPNGFPNDPMTLNNLGIVLHIRFQHLGRLVDIDEAIAQQQAAVHLTPHHDPARFSHLGNLGNSFFSRFKRLRNIEDINNAIARQQSAVDLVPAGHPDKPMLLSNLGSSLDVRFGHLGNIADIDTAITSQETAVNLTPDRHAAKPMYLTNLGGSLMTRFKRFGRHIDINDSIARQQAALNLTQEGHPNKCGRLFNLACSFEARFQFFSDIRDAEEAIASSSAAALYPAGAPTNRLNAAKLWISVASSIDDKSLMDAYECALGLIPRVAWLGLPIQDRHQHLITIGGIVRNAVAAAISSEECSKALEWLEQGRSIVWTQVLQLRTPVDQLRDKYPDLAEKLLRVSQLLDQGIGNNSASGGTSNTLEQKEQRYRSLTVEWESIIEQVRSLPDFKNFLKPLKSTQLIRSAHNGPIIIFNTAEKRCDALAILPEFEEVIHIPLPNITYKRVMELRDELKDILYSSGIRTRGERAAQKLGESTDDEDYKDILAELWNKLVKPVLDSLAFSPHPDVLPRVWWCTTGPLAFLPIHAAGIYDSESSDSQLSNYVISSYTPTLSTLLERSKPAFNSPFKLLSVIQTSAPGTISIPNTKQELRYIQHRFAGREHTVLDGPEGIKSKVIKEMEHCNWVHLACHGIQKPNEPTKSALILEDGDLTLEEIVRLDLPHAELAFLSACQTTAGDERLSEEAVHIAGGMLLAGYRGVVATMWSIRDDLAPEVTNEFYGYIMEDGKRPDSRKAAEALHMAIQKLRKRSGVSFMDWIPFVHLGI